MKEEQKGQLTVRFMIAAEIGVMPMDRISGGRRQLWEDLGRNDRWSLVPQERWRTNWLKGNSIELITVLFDLIRNEGGMADEGRGVSWDEITLREVGQSQFEKY